MRTVQTLKSGETSGMPSASAGRTLAGRARYSYEYSVSKMFPVTTRE